MKAFLIALLKLELAVIFFGIFGPAFVAVMSMMLAFFWVVLGGDPHLPMLEKACMWGMNNLTWWYIQ